MAKGIAFALVASLGLAFARPGVQPALAANADEPAPHVVVIEAMKFTPSTLEIRPGDRVTFKNNDLVPHTVAAKPKQSASFDSGNLPPGASWTVSPRSQHPIHYACTYHPIMEGTIVVKP